MACFKPLRAYMTAEGHIAFNYRFGSSSLDLPCGQCIGCRLRRTREWALRCVHESEYHDESCLITLTYDDEHLPFAGSLVKWHFQDFVKRLRARVCRYYTDEEGVRQCENPIKYFMCGEYGEISDRPHYHALIFGFDFSDKVKLTMRGEHPVYTSEFLSDLWPYGIHEIGSVTFDSAAYVANYVGKKNGYMAEIDYMNYVPQLDMWFEVEHEYINMSNGIGKQWCDDFLDEVADDDIPYRGASLGSPRYYLQQLESRDLMAFEEVKEKRKAFAHKNFDENSDKRLAVREVVAKARQDLFKQRTL